jgi:serine/threonine-protein kinase RsbW
VSKRRPGTRADGRGSLLDIDLPASATSLARVRRALTGAGREVGMAEDRIDDLKIAVSEACTNVVLHAYEDEPGRMRVRAWPERDRLVVVVGDDGVGILPRAGRRSVGLGLGLRMIATLASDMTIASDPGRGTEVQMSFALAGGEGAGG